MHAHGIIVKFNWKRLWIYETHFMLRSARMTMRNDVHDAACRNVRDLGGAIDM